MAAKSNIAFADERTLVITRIFDAPVSLVWQAWTQDGHLRKWSAPRGFMMESSEGDLRPGGTWRASMRAPDGNVLWLGGAYRELVENKLLVMTHYWDDETGKPGPETVVTVRFEDLGGKTRMIFEQTGFDSVPSRDGHSEGWTECFDILAGHLATMA